MTTQTRDGLNRAYDATKGKEEGRKILAAHYVPVKKMTREEAADMVFVSASSVGNWVARYAEGGADVLRGLPRPGRPREVGREEMGAIIDKESRPHATAEDVRQAIHGRTGAPCHPATVRLRMREHGLSHKRGHSVHANRAADSAVRRWQWRAASIIRKVEAAGFTVVAQDGAIITHGAGEGIWSRRGGRVLIPYTGRRRKAVAHAPVASDGRRPCGLRRRLGAPVFVAHLKRPHKKFGRAVVFLDMATQHRAGESSEFVLGCGGVVRLACLPAGTPELNVVEGPWRQLRRLLVGLHVSDFGDFRRVVGGLLRIMRHGLYAHTCLNKRVRRDPVVPRR